MTDEKFIAELMKLKGLTKRDAQRLIEAGVKSLKKLGTSIPEELANNTGIPKKKLTTWIILARARERKKFLEVDSATAELSQLLEIKMEYSKRLVAAGVMSINDLAEESPELLAEDTGLEVILIREWIKRAKALKRIPPDERKVKKVAPTITVSGFGKFSGALIGSKAAFKSIYNSGNIGAGFFLLLIGSSILGLYLTLTNYDKLMSFYNMIPMLGNLVINVYGSLQFYYGWFFLILGIMIIGWLFFSLIVKGVKGGSFSNTAAVIGFGSVPGVFFTIAVIAKFIDSSLLFGLKAWIVPVIAGIVSLWVFIILIRGAAAVPKE
ncbi:MAG: helix-hairpin-helix domain-containing protein [Candidatus Helarchaeota archaeon]